MSDRGILGAIAADGRAHLPPRRTDDDAGIGLGLGAIPDYPVEVLPVAARSLVACGVEAGLPAALLGGAVLAAMAAAIGPTAQIEVTPTWHERAILWIPLLAPRGAGKSPSQDLAFEPLRSHDAQLGEDDDGEVLFGDTTLEALARSLHGAHGAGTVDLDELAVLLRGMGEYKRGAGGDRGRFLALWSGAPWRFTRVGGGDKTNKVKLRVPRPTLTIVGGLQPALHELLGGEEDGLRPRWLPHLAALPDEEGDLGDRRRPSDWQMLLGQHLLPKRQEPREWKLGGSALAAFEGHRRRWKASARAGESASTSAALVKGDVHCARIALVLAEAQAPGRGGEVEASVINRAARIVDFTIDCWRALPEQGGLALSTRDWRLDQHLERLVAWLEEHGGQASRRELQQARVAGARTASDLDALLKRYEERFPGHVTEDTPPTGGLATVIVRAPRRVPSTNGVDSGNTDIQAHENGRSRAKSDGVATVNTDRVNTGSGNTAPGGCSTHPDGPRSGCRYCARAA
jgi:hypothetical protein